MDGLKSKIGNEKVELLIWDFDGVIFDLDWYSYGTPEELLEKIYAEINRIDSSIIKDKYEFISRLFPYPEISEVGIRYGKYAQNIVKDIFQKKESVSIDKAVPNHEVINFIKETNLPQAIWSNNMSSTIEYLLKKSGIDEKVNSIASLDKVIQAKPHVEGFEIIEKSNSGVKKENILMIGDSLRSDKVAAENTGIGFYHYQKL